MGFSRSQNVSFSSLRDNKQNIGNPCKHWFAGVSLIQPCVTANLKEVIKSELTNMI